MRGRRLLFAADYSLSELESSIPGISLVDLAPWFQCSCSVFMGAAHRKIHICCRKAWQSMRMFFSSGKEGGAGKSRPWLTKSPPSVTFWGALLCSVLPLSSAPLIMWGIGWGAMQRQSLWKTAVSQRARVNSSLHGSKAVGGCYLYLI